MKRKILATLLASVMALSLIGCGAKEAPAADAPAAEAEAPAAEEAAPAEEAAASGSNKLTVWCWDPAFNIYSMEEAGKVYKASHPDFELEVIETPWEDVQTKLTTAATSGDLSTLPDIFLMQDNAFQKNVISFPDAFTDLTNTGIDFSQFAAAKAAYSVVDGKNYGVPFDNGAVIACYRTDVLAEAGYTIEDLTDITWSRYIEIGKDVLAKTGKPLLSCTAGESDVICMMLQSAGSSLFDDQGNPNMVNNAVLKEVMSTYAELVNSGVMIEVNDWDQYIGSMTNSTVAGTINGCWIMASIQTAADQAGNWAVTNMPKMEGVDGATNYSNNGGSSWAVTANCKNPELAADFLGSTFGGSVELYETIISCGALATYLPAADSAVYGEAVDFYGGDAVYSKIVEFSGKTPTEARDAAAVAITNIVAGADVDAEIANAEQTVNFAMGR